MAIAAVLLAAEPKREVFLDIFRRANTNQLAIAMPPHVSLAVFDEVNVPRLDSAVKEFARNISPLNIWMSSVAMFPNERPVVYAQPVINSALLETHRRFHHYLGDLADHCSDYYKPDKWSPHLTLGTTDSLSSALDIISVAYDAKITGSYLFDKVSLIEFHPVNIISSYSLDK